MKIISVNIQKGGCGKTTSVQMIAEILSNDYGKKVLCIDTDPQCNLSVVSGIALENCRENNFYTFLKGNSNLPDCIKHTKYYDIIPSSIFLAKADTEFSTVPRDRYLLNHLAKTAYDLILIDTPPALGYLNALSLSISSSVLIPTECSYLSMVGLNQLGDTINEVRRISNPDLDVMGILMIKYNARTNLNHVIVDGLKEMARQMDTKVFDTKIRETVKVREAQSQSEPIIDWAGESSAVKDYRDFVREALPVLE